MSTENQQMTVTTGDNLAKHGSLTRNAEMSFSSKEKQLVRDTVAEDLNEREFDMFMYQCQRTGLDPLTKQIYAFKNKDKVTIQASIDGLRIVAERTGQYKGQTPAEWCGKDGEWREVWTADEPPTAARVGVYREGFKEPVYGVALWSDYAQTYKNGNPTYMWENMGPHMLAKCAEALGLRKTFPQDLSGIYSSEEMQQASDEPTTQKPTHPADMLYHIGVPGLDVRDGAYHYKGEKISEKEANWLSGADARLSEVRTDEVPSMADELQAKAKSYGNDDFTRRVTDLCEEHITAAMAEERAEPEGA